MADTKEEAIRLIQTMPEQCTLTDIMAELYFKQKVVQGLRDIEEGKTLTQEQVRRRMAKWAQLVAS